MFVKNSSFEWRTLMDGVEMRPLSFGERTNICEFRLKKGHSLPSHQHPYEQTGTLLSGKLNFRINNQWHLAEPGDSWSIPENVEHEVEVLENSLLIEVFSPVRPDYLPQNKKV
jgi:quercetin dioxygenase-like cupin family protein